MTRSIFSRARLARRIGLVAIGALSILAVGAGSGEAANPFVAGDLSSRPISVSPAVAAQAVARARALGSALGLPGVRHTAERVDDAFDHRTYDEVTAFDGAGREVAITRFDPDGTLVLAVALGWRPGRGNAVDGSAAANRAVAAVRAAGIGAPGRPSVRASSGAGGWTVSWPRVVDGATVRGDGIRVLLFADGTFHGLTRTERPLAETPVRRIAEAAAAELAMDRLAASIPDVRDLALVAAVRAWVAPNDAFGGPRADAPGAVLRQVWAIRYEARSQLAERLRAVEVWIDAGDGSVVGGDVIE